MGALFLSTPERVILVFFSFTQTNTHIHTPTVMQRYFSGEFNIVLTALQLRLQIKLMLFFVPVIAIIVNFFNFLFCFCFKYQPDSGALLHTHRVAYGMSGVFSCWLWYLRYMGKSAYQTSQHQIRVNHLLGIPWLFHRKLYTMIIYCRIQVISVIQIAYYAMNSRYIAVQRNQMIHTNDRLQS